MPFTVSFCMTKVSHSSWLEVHKQKFCFGSHFFLWDLGDEQAAFKMSPKNAERVDVFRNLLTHFQGHPKNLYSWWETQDETWGYHFESETKFHSQQYKHSGSPLLKKFQKAKSFGEMMVSTLWDCEGVIMKDYLEKRKGINRQYYVAELNHLKEVINLKSKKNLRSECSLAPG